MKILICPDKFKGSLSAEQVAQILESGLLEIIPNLSITKLPLADGGEGSLRILPNYLNLERIEMESLDPLGRPIQVHYFVDEQTAYFELALSSGLLLLNEEEYDPLQASTLGTGLLINDAIQRGIKKIYLFIGGSATNDGGIGICHALGFRFLNDSGLELIPNGENLSQIQAIKKPDSTDFRDIDMTVLTDVNNPLLGSTGAAKVFAKQKGADDSQIDFLERGMQNFALLLNSFSSIPVDTLPGTGAAGGIAASLTALCQAKISSGFDFISQVSNLETHLKNADLILSGEGRLDSQSPHGKLISKLAYLSQKHHKPLFLFVGKNELDDSSLKKMNIKAVFSISSLASTPEDAITQAKSLLLELIKQKAPSFLV